MVCSCLRKIFLLTKSYLNNLITVLVNNGLSKVERFMFAREKFRYKLNFIIKFRYKLYLTKIYNLFINRISAKYKYF
jgi:hypothetical protein